MKFEIRKNSHRVLCAFLLLSLTPPLARAGSIAETLRFSLNSVPRTGAAPLIDGVVGKREWEDAALLPNLIDSRSGLAADGQSRVYLCHDDKALYIGFQIERPEKARTPAETDEVEIVLDPGHSQKTVVKLRGNLTSLIGSPQGNCQYKAHATQHFGWEGEMAITFESLKRNTPAVGEVWGFDFINRQRTPVEETVAYSFKGKGGNAAELSHIVFRRDSPALRFRQAGTFFGQEGGGAVLEIPNGSDQPLHLNVSLELWKRKSGAKGNSFLPSVAGGVTGNVDIIAATSQEIVGQELLKYEPVKAPGAGTNGALMVAPNRLAQVRIAAAETGEYLLKYRIANGEKIISSGLLPYRLAPPMRLDLTPYFLSPGVIEVKADLRKAKEWVTGAKAKFALVKKKGDTPIEEATREFAEQSELFVALPTTKLGAGGYLVTMDLLGADGKSRGGISEGFHKPATPEWMLKKVGREPIIPAPWVPIQAGEHSLSFLMGDYQLTDFGLPSQINVRSIYEERRVPILSGPIVLQGSVNGKPIVWNQSENKIAAAKPELVEVAGQASFEGLAVKARTEFEYDGMAKLILKLAPTGGQPVAIDHLCLEFPLMKEFSTLYLRSQARDGYKQNELLPAGAVPKDGLKHEFVYSVWLGNEERGLRWFSENTRGWHIGKAFLNQAIEAVPSARGTVLRLNLFKDEKAFSLDKEREIVIGYMFTPSRTPRAQSIYHGVVHDRMAETAGSLMNCGESWMFPLQGWPIVPNAGNTEKLKELQKGGLLAGTWPVLNLEQMRAIVATAHKIGVAVTPYAGWGIQSESEEYKTYGEEMIVHPLSGMGCGGVSPCWNTSMQDMYTALLRDRILDVDIDGFRMDSGFSVINCQDLQHSGYGSTCGYFDDDGKLQPSMAIFAARQAAQRAYRLFHGGVKQDGLCLHHIHYGNRFDPILDHMDGVVSAEGAEMKARSLTEFPLDFFRANVMGDAHGWQVIYMAKAERVGYDARLGICLLHNFNPRGGHEMQKSLTTSYCRSSNLGTGAQVWAARDWIGPYEKGTELWGYWKNAKYLATGNANVKGTFQVRRGEKLLLGLLNLDRKAVEVPVRIDLQALGFTGKLYAYDPMLREAVALDGNMIKLAFTPEGMRLIQIASSPFDIFVPEKVGANLIAELVNGVPQGWSAGQYVDEKDLRKPTLDELHIENGVLTIQGRGDNVVGLRKSIAASEKGKPYMLEAEVRVDCADGSFLGENVDNSYFWISCGVTSSYNHDFRLFGSQMAPGHTEKVRLYFIRGEDPIMVDFRMSRAKGAVTIKNLALYELKSAPPWCKQGAS